MSAQNPYAPPKAKVDAGLSIADIGSLPVSDSWKRKFKAILKAGGPNLPDIKNLTSEERKAIPTFNVLAFLFGPFYYLFKGMWKKGLTLFVLCFIGILILDAVMGLVGLGNFTRATGFAAAAVFGALANRDYYTKMVLGQNGWWWPKHEVKAAT
jgi:uncharacterized protein DUF2628